MVFKRRHTRCISNLFIIVDPRAFRSTVLSLGLLDSVALLSCSSFGGVGDHAVDSKGVGRVLFELDWSLAFLCKVRLVLNHYRWGHSCIEEKGKKNIHQTRQHP